MPDVLKSNNAEKSLDTIKQRRKFDHVNGVAEQLALAALRTTGSEWAGRLIL